MQHLGPKCPTGKWIMIISELEQQRHKGPSPHIRSISGDAHSRCPPRRAAGATETHLFFWSDCIQPKNPKLETSAGLMSKLGGGGEFYTSTLHSNQHWPLMAESSICLRKGNILLFSPLRVEAPGFLSPAAQRSPYSTTKLLCLLLWWRSKRKR